MTYTELVVIGLAVVGAFHAYVTIRLLSSEAYSSGQKVRQLLIVWLLPILGAVFVLVFMESDVPNRPRGDTRFTKVPGENPEGIGSGSEHA